MKKLLYSMAVMVAMFCTSCDHYDHAIADQKDRLDILEQSTIKNVDDQVTAIQTSITELEAVNAELDALIETLQTADTENAALISALEAKDAELEAADTELEALIEALTTANTENAQLISTLEAKDAELEAAIADLKEYVDDEISATEDWAKATFATLEQYAELEAAIADLKEYVDVEISATEDWAKATFATLEQYTELKAELSDLSTLVEQQGQTLTSVKTSVESLTTSISTLETSMKEWVNTTLANGYYDIATIDAKLSALETEISDGDEALAQQIADQQTALEAAKTDLKTAYENAISEAITTYNGTITATIANDIAAAKNELQNQIDDITENINDIESRLSGLEGQLENLIARIQSIRFLPEYSDGKVELNAETVLTFILSPKETAAAIAAAVQNNDDVVTAYVSRTKTLTRAVDMPTTLAIKSVTGNVDGVLEVTISSSDLPNDFWKEHSEANIYICISDGNNDIISEMIPIRSVENISDEETFTAAFATEDNIVLTGDIDLTEPISVANGRNVTIDLNGRTISGTATSASASNLIEVKNGGSLTIKNGTISFYAANPDTEWGGEGQPPYPGYANNTIRNTGELTIENATIENKTQKGGASYVIDNYAGSRLTINSGATIIQSGGDQAIRMFNSSEAAIDVTINGGTIIGHRAVWIQLAGSNTSVSPEMNLTINGGTLTSTDPAYNLAVYSYSYGNDMKDVKIQVSGGTFEGDIALTGGSNKTNIEQVAVSGGTFNGLYGYIYSYGDDAKAASAINVTGGNFSSLYILSYMGEGEKADIKLVENHELDSDEEGISVAKGATATLDLNGFTVSQSKAQTNTYAMITNKGNLTIMDRSSEKNGKISYKDITEYTADVNYASNTIRNEGTLTLEAGTIENISGDDVMDYGYPHVIDAYQGSTTNIKGGTVKSANYDCIRMFCNSTTLATTVNISGGNIINRVSFQNPTSNTAGYGRLNITGGTFTSTDNITANVRLLNFSSDISNMKAVISGGTFDKGVKTQNYGSAQISLNDWLTVTNVTIPEVQ